MYLAICDDHSQELDVLEAFLQSWQKDRGVTLRHRRFDSAAALLDAAEKERFSCYFLDVMMPGIDGLEAAREIRSFDDAADIVFLTTSPDYAYKSYRVRALDYLLKPIEKDLLFSTLDRLLQKEQTPQDSLTLKCGSTMIRLPLSQLSYVEVNGKHLYFNLTDGSVREVSGSLNEYEGQLLLRPEFMRPHRSYIVNMLQVSELSPAGICTFSGRRLPVSRLLYAQLQKDYMNLLFAEQEDHL